MSSPLSSIVSLSILNQKSGTRKADFQAMRSHLVETKWEEEFLGTANAKNCEDLWISLKSKIYDLRNKFVPKITTSGKPSRSKKGSVPINKNLKEAIRQKNSTH